VSEGSAEAKTFEAAMDEVTMYLAKEIARDGEARASSSTVEVSGAESEADARLVAKAIAGSCLLKAASTAPTPTGTHPLRRRVQRRELDRESRRNCGRRGLVRSRDSRLDRDAATGL
jgi:hypothetical protein